MFVTQLLTLYKLNLDVGAVAAMEDDTMSFPLLALRCGRA